MGKELLLEIGTEEIPALFIPKAMADLADILRRDLKAARILCGEVRTMATPRRLVVHAADVAEMQADQQWEKLGPAKRVAFDDDGSPTKAAIGFARAQGVNVEELVILTTDKGEYVGVRKTLKGVPTASLLPEILAESILALPFPKSMRWGEVTVRFARPIHWILALFGGEVVSFTIGNVTSGNQSCGHRFMSHQSFLVADGPSYKEEMRRRFVVGDPEERRHIIEREAQEKAREIAGVPLITAELLREVTFLVEYPLALLGSFHRDFLVLPREVLTTCMMSHQKYFPVVSEEGELLPYFITIANTVPRDPQVVIKGNEKVLRARLTDAKFFFDADRKIPLERRVEDLKEVVYHRLLGTSYEKVCRFRALAAWIVEQINPSLAARVERVAYLAKADLTTQWWASFLSCRGSWGGNTQS